MTWIMLFSETEDLSPFIPQKSKDLIPSMTLFSTKSTTWAIFSTSRQNTNQKTKKGLIIPTEVLIPTVSWAITDFYSF